MNRLEHLVGQLLVYRVTGKWISDDFASLELGSKARDNQFQGSNGL